MDSTNKRKMERFQLKLPVKLFKHNTPDKQEPIESSGCYTKDISSGGAFIETDSALPVGTKVQADISLPMKNLKSWGKGSFIINAIGSIVRANKEGMAICFQTVKFCPVAV